MELGDNLKLLRQRKGLTQDDVAKAVGVTRKTYASWEKGIAPRKDVYKKLAEVLDCDIHDLFHFGDSAAIDVDLKGGAILGAVGGGTAGAMAAAMGAGPLGIAGALLFGIVKGLSKAPKTITLEIDDDDSLDSSVVVEQVQEISSDYERHQKQFQALSLGLVYQALGAKGIAFRPVVTNQDSDHSVDVLADTVIDLSGERFESWQLLFYGMDNELSDKIPLSADTKAEVFLARLISLTPSKDRKISIVVDDDEVYAALTRYKGRNSFRGYLSAILVDTREVRIDREEYLSVYEDQDDWEILPRII